MFSQIVPSHIDRKSGGKQVGPGSKNRGHLLRIYHWSTEKKQRLANRGILSGANPLFLQYVNTRIEEREAERQNQPKLVANFTANSVSASQIDSITGYLDNWEFVSFDDECKVVDILISQLTLPVRKL